MSRVEDLILQAYATDPKVVDHDWYLIGAMWKLDGWDDGKSLFENLKVAIQAESITRARRKLHEDGKIKYSDEAEERRYEQYKEKTEEYGSPTVILDDETNTARFIGGDHA